MRGRGPIYVDAGQAAYLRCGGQATPRRTLHDAVVSWRDLPSEERKNATVSAPAKGVVYKPGEIERLRWLQPPDV